MKIKFLHYGLAALFVGLILLIYTCRKDKNSVEAQLTDLNTDLNILGATAYYKQLASSQGGAIQINGLRTQSLSSNSVAIKIKYAMFNRSYASATGRASFVEVPILFNRKTSLVFNYDKQLTPDQQSEVFKGTFDRLLIYKSKATGTINQKILTYIPDIDYLKAHHNDISNNRINKLDPDFTGMIEYSNIDGSPLCLFVIKQHKLIKKVKLKPGANQANTTKTVQSTGGTVKTNDLYICGETEMPIYQTQCDVTSEMGTYAANCTEELVGYDSAPLFCDSGQPGQTGNDCTDYGLGCPNDPAPDLCLDYGICDNNGGGSGDTDALEDPCNSIKTTAAQSANNMVNGNASIANSFNTAIQNSATTESAFHIDLVNNSYTASTPVASANEKDTYSSASPNANTVAIGHDHHAYAFPQPSPFDIYSAGELAVQTNGQINMSYVLSPSSNYVLVVTNKSQFATFLTNYPKSSNLEKDANGDYTADFDPNSGIKSDVVDGVMYDATSLYIKQHFADPSSMTPAEHATAEVAANEVAMAYFLAAYNTGITLLKKYPATNTYQPVHVTSIKLNNKIYYSSSPCN